MTWIWRKKRLNVKTYEPSSRMDVDKEATVPILFYLGSRIVHLSDYFVIFFSGFFYAARGLFHAKRKIRDVQSRFETTIDFRRRKKS